MTRRRRRSEGDRSPSPSPHPLFALLIVLGTTLMWLFLGPVQLGGATAYSVVSGNSMEPLLHKGDLAAVRQGKSYGVGDVALYESEALKGQRVLHRILTVGDGTYTFKGDNNDFVDPETVPATALVGRLWFHGSHVGSVMTWIREPWRAAMIAAVAAAIALGSRLGARPRRRRHTRPSHAIGRGDARFQNLWAPATASLVVIVAVAGAGFTKPLTTGLSEAGAFRHEGTFSYAAKIRDPNPAYPSGVAETGQPVFFSLSDSLRLTFDYRFVSRYAHDVKGTVALKALISDSTGWHQVLDVSDPVAFDGSDHASIGGQFPLSDLRALVAQLAVNSGLPGAEYPLYLQPVVTVAGTVQGRAIQSTFSPVIPVSLTETLLKVASANTIAVPGTTTAAQADVFHPTLEESARVTGPNTLVIARYHVAVRTIRLLAIVLFGAWIIAVSVLARRRRALLDDAAIAAVYGNLLVPVGSLDALTSLPTVPVADFEVLAKLAGDLEAPLLVETTGALVRYAVVTESMVFLHEPVPHHAPFALPPGSQPPPPATGPHREAEPGGARQPTPNVRLPKIGSAALQFAPLLLPLVVAGSIVMSFTATSVLPTSYAGVSKHPVVVSQLAPGSCSSLVPTSLLVAASATVTGTAANDLILGQGDSGKHSLNGAGGNDCVVAGGGSSTTNTIDGGAGTDVCVAPAVTKPTFKNCELQLAT
ncbi:MAG: signal peptidase endoplasmic reticulum-type [Acidimicrobiales bacterium]|nr:signal peptidase endoplasmic reticulum-type [Acidimicrobiales bacterium]